LTPWKGGEENGDEYKNGVGLGSASGVCDRVYDRLRFLYRVGRYLARLYGLLADAGNRSPRILFLGAFLFDPNDKPHGIGKTKGAYNMSGNVNFLVIVGRDDRGGRPDLSRAG
jgi:hypothetical protein